MNRNSQVGISPSEAVSKVAVGMREITVKVSGSKGRHGLVLALGNPFGGRGPVTTGIVHSPVGNSPWLFADIRLTPGYSGGPLTETSGTVIGINCMIVGPLGCAITSDSVEEFLSRFHLSEAA